MGGSLQSFDAETEQALRVAPADDLLSLPYLAQRPDLDSMSAYGFAKRGNRLRVQGAAAAWGARGARVNTVSPSPPRVTTTAAGPAASHSFGDPPSHSASSADSFSSDTDGSQLRNRAR